MKIKTLFIAAVLLQLFTVSYFAQDVEAQPESILIDSFSYTNSEDMMARIDNFTVQMQNNPSAKGYIVIKGKKPARITVEKEIKSYLKMRAFDMKSVVFLNGEGDKTAKIELWLVPPGAKPPAIEKKSEKKPQAILSDAFRYANSEDMMARIDSFTVQMQNNPSAKVYIITNGNKRTRMKVGKEVKNYIKIRFSNTSRLVFLNGDGDTSAYIELWIVPNGAEPPAPKKAVDEASDKFEMPDKPFVFSEEYALDLNESLDAEGYAEVLKQYPKSRGNIVILETSQKLFKQEEKEILSTLKKNGIARNRLRTFFKKVKAENMKQGIKLWILP